MPAFSRTLEDEGVVIPPTRLTGRGAPRSRRPDAQPAPARGGPPRPARRRPRGRRAGGRADRPLRPRHPSGPASRRRSTTPSAARAPGSPSCEDGIYRANGRARGQRRRPRAEVEARVEGDGMELDFTGSAEQHDGNLNCPLAVTLSACYFALRVLTDPDVPPCAGAYRPLTVTAPEGSILNARPPAAVAAGNVETSSRVADLVLAAFGHALGQGTMNNLTLGQRRLHLLRDARRRPGRLPGRRRAERRPRGDVEHAQHAGRGAGAGVPAAGRRVLAPARLGRRRARTAAATASCASSRRSTRCASRSSPSAAGTPRPGAEGGEHGAPGRNLLNGEELPAKASGTLQPGDRLRIETPGGGGYGK